MYLTTMKIFHLITILLLFSSFCSVLSHPSRPLNERSTELALQEAWLLIDDQNQSKQNVPDLMRRKVVAKSVFIAPTFKPEELPPCADGYTSDSMGRCVKIIQIDPDEHLKFLFQKLVGNFGAEDQQDSMSTTGPIQISIDLPLTKNMEDDSGDVSKATDVALVFTTSNNAKPVKRDEENEDDTATKTWQQAMEDLNFSFVAAPTNGSFDPARRNVKNEEKNSGDTETTTASITDTTTEATTEQVFSTSSSFGDETAATATYYTETTTQTVPPDTTTFEPETEEDRHALFFKVPLQPAHVKNGTNLSPVKANFAVTDTTATVRSRIKFDEEESVNNDEPALRDSTNIDDGSSRIIFKDELTSDTDLMTSENVRQTSNRIRFPDDIQYAENSNPPNLNHFKRPQRQNHKPENQFTHLFDDAHTRGSDLAADQQQNVFGNQRTSLDDDTQSNQHRHQQVLHDNLDRFRPNAEFGSTTERHFFNRRNRDKNFWRLPPTWRESSPKRALVLRFSRRPGNGEIAPQGDVYRHTSEPLYRQVRIEDLSYIFGHRRKRSNLR